MSTDDAPTTVQILGEEFRVAGASEEEVRALAEFVDRRFRDAQMGRPTADMKRLAVSVCLGLAEELFEARRRNSVLGSLEAEAVHRVRRCRETLDLVLAETAGPVAGVHETG